MYNIDVNRKHKVIGQTLLDLEEVNLNQGKLNLTSDLQRYVKASETGDTPEILLSLCFNGGISRLTVNVVECRNLKVDSNVPPDTYVKVQLMHQAKVSLP